MRDQIVKIIRDARDLMNHGGRHWIKGAETGFVNPETHKPGDTPESYIMEEEGYEAAYCSIGALDEVATGPGAYKAHYAATIEVAKALNPGAMEEAEREIVEDFKQQCECDGDTFKRSDWELDIQDRLYEIATETIPDVNDDPSTTWEDIRGAFTLAARRVSQRKAD